MANPAVSSVTIDGRRFNTLSTHFSLSTMHDVGMPVMGQLVYSIEALVDMHDTGNMPFHLLQMLYGLASTVVKASINDIKVEFWTDDSQSDAICSYSFRGWISHFSNSSGSGANHILSLSLVPALDQQQFVKMTRGN